MAARPYRIAIVGASSLAGKELADTLAESSLADSDIVLLDIDDSAAGLLTAAGDEPAFIQKIDRDSFTGVDFVFFTGDPQVTVKYWKAARLAGASIVDLTYALEAEPGVLLLAPLVSPLDPPPSPHASPHAPEPDLNTPAVVSAHPAALMLLLAARRIHAAHPLRALSATVLEPASEHGRAAMDELHQQTVTLLSFQTLPRLQFDAQVAFNLLPSLGPAAKIDLPATQSRILAHYSSLFPASPPAPNPSTTGLPGAGPSDPASLPAVFAKSSPKLALQLAQAPVFHGYVASVLIELHQPATSAQIEAALQGEPIDLVIPTSDPPSNLSAAGQPNVLVRVRSASPSDTPPGDDQPFTRLWLWLAADNLKLAALNAIACANQLRRLRPQGTVQ